MELSYVRSVNPFDVSVTSVDHYVPLHKVYVGPQATATLRIIANNLRWDHQNVELFL